MICIVRMSVANGLADASRPFTCVPRSYSHSTLANRVIQDIEKRISEAKHKQLTATLTRQGGQDELNDLTRQRKELELRVEDLRAADQRAGGKRAEYEAELAAIEDQIRQKEHELAGLLPEWEGQRERDAEQRKALEVREE